MSTKDFYSKIPEVTMGALERYANQRIRTGSFLESVLTNDLFGALGRADESNHKALRLICLYVYNEMPSSCWGSKERVETWLKGE